MAVAEIHKDLSKQVPKGCTEEAVARAMIVGYSKFGLNMLQPSPAINWTIALLIQERAVQKPEIFGPFMIMKQDEYAQLKSDNIIGQIVTPALAAKREQFLTLERERSSAAVQSKISLSSSLPPKNSYANEQTLTGAQCN